MEPFVGVTLWSEESITKPQPSCVGLNSGKKSVSLRKIESYIFLSESSDIRSETGGFTIFIL